MTCFLPDGVPRAPMRHNHTMRISARGDYAVRAAMELAAHAGQSLTAEALATAQDIPHRFLERILADLCRAGLVISQRGSSGGYRLARPARAISVADVVRAVEGPLVYVRDARPSDLAYTGAATALLDVWVALRASVREVLENTTLADVVERTLPESVMSRANTTHAWANG